MKRLSLSLAAVLPACAVDGAMEPYKQEALSVSPLKREIAAADIYLGCKPHPRKDRFDAICDVCNVDLYPDKDLPFNADPDIDAPIVGVRGWATHFYHEIETDPNTGMPSVAITGERASEKFETRELDSATIHALFDEATAWCRARGVGEFRLLKNEIDAFSGEVSQ